MNHLLKLISFTILLILISIAFYGIYKSFNKINKLDTIGHEVQKTEANIGSTIIKHSVRPYYGNYVKHDDSGNTCHPWQYCQ